MKIKKSALYNFALAWLVCILTIVVYYSHYNVELKAYPYAIVYSFITTVTLIYVLYSVNNMVQKEDYSLAISLLMITVLYNQNSITKFSVDQLLQGYIDSQPTRLLGGLFVNLTIVVATFILSRINNKSTRSFINKDAFNVRAGFIYITILLYFVIRIGISAGVIVLSRTQEVYFNSLTYIVYSLVIIYAKNRENSKSLSKYIPIFLLTIINLYFSLVGGSKSLLIKYLVVIAIGLYFTGMLSFKWLKFGFIVSPIFLQLYTVLSEYVSSRMQYFSTEWLMSYHAFRYDLSDFAISIASKGYHLRYLPGLFRDAFIFAIPGFSSSVKNAILVGGTYRVQLTEMGFPNYDIYGTQADFNDTLFSIGAELFGYAGIVIFFILIMLLFDLISQGLKKSNIGFVLLLVLLGSATLTECDLLMLVYSLRDMLVIYIIAFVYYKLLYLFRKKKRKAVRTL